MLAAGVALAIVLSPAPVVAPVQYARAVDGDTIQLASGRYVRLLGYDTAEYGTCGFWDARALMTRLVRDGVRLVHVSGKDKYGRTLAYVRTRDGRDVGTVMLRRGLAVARYDGLDGYQWHSKQSTYRRLDRTNGRITC